MHTYIFKDGNLKISNNFKKYKGYLFLINIDFFFKFKSEQYHRPLYFKNLWYATV